MYNCSQTEPQTIYPIEADTPSDFNLRRMVVEINTRQAGVTVPEVSDQLVCHLTGRQSESCVFTHYF